MSELLSSELTRLLSEAAQTEARCIKATAVGDKPYVHEGDLFVGNHEGATEVAYGESHLSADTASLEVHLIYVDPRFPKAHAFRAVAWSDTVELRRLDGRWFVTDVKFSQGQSLAMGLQSYIAMAAQYCGSP